ncbi:MAG: HNH endonuclease [Opitutaceae bacterium]
MARGINDMSPNPYKYPITKLIRRHGPHGYATHRQYLPWLRDEFDFRCAYCLLRETWAQMTGDFEVDHFLPQSIRDELKLSYDNLIYACGNCNRRKGARALPSPHEFAFGACVRVDTKTGEIFPLNDVGERLIDELALDTKKKTRQRRTWLDLIKLSRESSDPSYLLKYMGLPEDLEDLKSKRPKSNSRPKGMEQSWHARKQRGDLPEFIE